MSSSGRVIPNVRRFAPREQAISNRRCRVGFWLPALFSLQFPFCRPRCNPLKPRTAWTPIDSNQNSAETASSSFAFSPFESNVLIEHIVIGRSGSPVSTPGRPLETFLLTVNCER
jgi:hypothetical protein